ncbi:MAG: dihydrofolate reductase [Thermodesulfobacteriota bacterium]
MEIVIIAAMAANRVIGRGNSLPWHLPADLRRFRERTMGHALIMGRRTFESIGAPLPGRRTVVVSRNRDFAAPGVRVAADIDSALALCGEEALVFIAGGGEIYRLALPLADRIELTVLPRPVAGDVLFPEIDEGDFRLLRRQPLAAAEDAELLVYVRRSPAGRSAAAASSPSQGG